MPDRGLDLKTLFSDKPNIATAKYQLLDVLADSRTTRTEHVTREVLVKNEAAIVDGVGFMKALFDEIDWQMTNTLQGIPHGRIEDPRRPTFRWEGEVAVLEKKNIGVLGSHPGLWWSFESMKSCPLVWDGSPSQLVERTGSDLISGSVSTIKRIRDRISYPRPN